ncbi:MAG: rhodanese-like domain-containing protein [Gammaproteobacteria bacterium]|nr:rhodanese-like domain-containing protein [Gammaproteobacteria bacterium]
MKKLLMLLIINQAFFNLGFAAQPVIIIDVRTATEYAAGHIDNAVNIPFDEIDKRIQEVTKDKNATIVLYCRSGRRSGIAQDTLADMGYKRVENGGSLENMKTRTYSTVK